MVTNALTFGGSTIRNSWASMLAAAARIIRELVLFKGSYISRVYGIWMIWMFFKLIELNLRVARPMHMSELHLEML